MAAQQLSPVQGQLLAGLLVGASVCAATHLGLVVWRQWQRRRGDAGGDGRGRSKASRAILAVVGACDLWEQAVQEAGPDEGEQARVRALLRAAYRLLELNHCLFGDAPDDGLLNESLERLGKVDVFAGVVRGRAGTAGPRTPHASRTSSVASTSTFVSTARDPLDVSLLDRSDAALPASERGLSPNRHSSTGSLGALSSGLFDKAAAMVRQGAIPCRKVRTRETGCSSDPEFLARLYCVRAGLELAMHDTGTREWMRLAGEQLVTQLLVRAGKTQSVVPFQAAFRDLLDFVGSSLAADGGEQMKRDLSLRGVVCLSYFDVVVDFLFLDAFDDLEDLPGSVRSALNSWAPRRAKQTLLQAAVWAGAKTRRNSRHTPPGVLPRFYAAVDIITPPLVFGLLEVAEPEFVALCRSFKSLVVRHTKELFELDPRNYTSLPEYANDLVSRIRSHIAQAEEIMGGAAS